jgi:hypothetical protein
MPSFDIRHSIFIIRYSTCPPLPLNPYHQFSHRSFFQKFLLYITMTLTGVAGGLAGNALNRYEANLTI